MAEIYSSEFQYSDPNGRLARNLDEVGEGLKAVFGSILQYRIDIPSLNLGCCTDVNMQTGHAMIVEREHISPDRFSGCDSGASLNAERSHSSPVRSAEVRPFLSSQIHNPFISFLPSGHETSIFPLC